MNGGHQAFYLRQGRTAIGKPLCDEALVGQSLFTELIEFQGIQVCNTVIVRRRRLKAERLRQLKLSADLGSAAKVRQLAADKVRSLTSRILPGGEQAAPHVDALGDVLFGLEENDIEPLLQHIPRYGLLLREEQEVRRH